MIIDSHYNFWKNSAFWDAWIDQLMSVIRKDFIQLIWNLFFKKIGLQKIYGLNQNE